MLNKSDLRNVAVNFILNTVSAFVLGIMFVTPWIFTEAEIAENTQQFWMMIFGR